jgi:hypothetical protein
MFQIPNVSRPFQANRAGAEGGGKPQSLLAKHPSTWLHDTQHNNMRHNNTQHMMLYTSLSA